MPDQQLLNSLAPTLGTMQHTVTKELMNIMIIPKMSTVINVEISDFYQFISRDLNPFAPGDFAKKLVLKLVEQFPDHCRAMKS